MYPSRSCPSAWSTGIGSSTAARRAGTGTGSRRIPKVGFHADDAAGEPGRALRAMYYQRKSKTKRRPSPSAAGGVDVESGAGWSLERVASVVAPLLIVWFVIAYFIPSPVGTYLPAIPDLVVIMLLAVGLLAFAMLRSANRWNTGSGTRWSPGSSSGSWSPADSASRHS